MSGKSKKSWDFWLPERYLEWSARKRLLRERASLADHFQAKLRNAKGDADQIESIEHDWSDEDEWPSDALAALETRRLRRLAESYGVDFPEFSESDAWVISSHRTGHTFLQARIRKKLLRDIGNARWEEMRMTLQVVVMPIVTIISLAITFVALVTRK